MSKLTSTRMVLANLGGISVAFLVPTIVRALSPIGTYDAPESAHAWLTTMTIFALVGIVLLVFCFLQSKERVVIKADKTSEVKASNMWTEFTHNRPLRVVALFIFTAFAMMSIYNAAGSYYVTYNLHAQEYTGLFQGIGFLPAFIFLPLLPAIIKAIGKKKIFYLFLVIAIVGMALLYIVSVVPEVISYGEHATGRRISGTVNAVIGIVFQLGLAVGLFIPNMVLGFVGFDKDNKVSQSAFAQQGVGKRCISCRQRTGNSFAGSQTE